MDPLRPWACYGANGHLSGITYLHLCLVSCLQPVIGQTWRGPLYFYFIQTYYSLWAFNWNKTMAPTKPSGISQMVTRMRAAANPKAIAENTSLNKKRKAETVLTSDNKKRSALGDLTNVRLSCCLPASFLITILCFYRLLANCKMPRKQPSRKLLPAPQIWSGPSWPVPPPSPQVWPRRKSKYLNQ